MFAIIVTDKGGAQRRVELSRAEATIGRVQGNDVVLAKSNVSKRHATIVKRADGFEVTDLGSLNGTYINGRKITSPRLVAPDDKIYIADFILRLEVSQPGASAMPVAPGTAAPPVQGHALPQPAAGASPGGTFRTSQLPDSAPPGLVPEPGALAQPAPPPMTGQSANSDSGDFRLDREPPGSGLHSDAPARMVQLPTPELGPLGTLMARLAERFNVHDVEPSSMHDQARWNAAQATITETLQSMQSDGLLGSDVDTAKLTHAALHEAVGLGALDDLLSDSAVREIVVRGIEDVQVDSNDGLQARDLRFSSRSALQTVARRLAAQTGRRLGQQPLFHGVLSFGPHVTIVQAPLAVNGPLIEIRAGYQISLEQLVEQEWLDQEAVEHLETAIEISRNVVVIGPQGAGVSTVISALANSIPDDTRMIAIEAVPDLAIDRSSITSFCSADTGMQLAEVIQQANRLRADRLIIDDVTGAETHHALCAIASREPGHMIGIHGPGGGDAAETLTVLTESGGVSPGAAARLIEATVHLIVQVRRTHEGHRITSIVEVEGVDEDDQLTTKELYA